MAVSPPPRPTSRSAFFSTVRALAVVLSAEFEVTFRFFNDQGQEVPQGETPGAENRERERSGGLPGPPNDGRLTQETALALLREGQSAVTWLGNGWYQLAMVLHEGNDPRLLAVGILPGLGVTGQAQAREQERLQRWLQAVADRIRFAEHLSMQRRADEKQAARLNQAWSVVLGLNDAIRKVRLQRHSDASCRAILEAARDLLGAQTVVWVPLRAPSPAVVVGEPVLASGDGVHLLSVITHAHESLRHGEPVVCNQDRAALWAARFPAVVNLVAASALDGTQGGSIVALNKLPEGRKEAAAGSAPRSSQRSLPPAFHRGDAVGLLPFASLLLLQARGLNRFAEVRELLVGLTRSLTAAIDAKDPSTYGHSERVARIAVELGRELGLSEDELSDLYLVGLLHDIGKIGIRDSVLSKNGPLNEEENEHIQQHVTIGYRILSDLRPLHSLLPGVLSHHERYDGKGYPQGLAGEKIPLLARIISVADSYDAMSTERPFREGLSSLEAEAELMRGAGTQWDAAVVEAFLRCRERIHLIRQRGLGESLTRALDGALRTSDSGERMLTPPRPHRPDRPAYG